MSLFVFAESFTYS